MSEDLNTEIKISANADGVEAGVSRAKRSLASLSQEAERAGDRGAAGLGRMGAGGDLLGRRMDSVTKNVQASLQRQIAALEAGGTATRQYQETIARMRGADLNALKPWLDQLDAAKVKAEAAGQAQQGLEKSMIGLGAAAGLAGRALAVAGIGASAAEFIRMADASTNVASRLSLVTNSTAELANVQQRLFNVAQASRVGYVDLVGTYAQMARSTKDLGVSQTSLLGVIQTISQAVTISGGSAASAQAALVQLAQGFSSGALRGEELNSVLEQTPRLAQAIADGLGVSIGKLREMGGAGELTATKVLGALEKSAGGVQVEFEKMTTTVEQAVTRLGNSMTGLVGAMDSLLGVTKTVSGAFGQLSLGMDAVADIFNKLGKQGPLRDAASEVRRLDDEARRLRQGIDRGIFGPQAQAELDRINSRLELAKQRFRELDRELGGAKDPRDQTGFPTRTQSYATEAKRLEAIQTSMGKVLNGLSGMKDGFYKDLNALYAGYQNGLIKLGDYQAAVAKLIKESGVEKPDSSAASAVKAEQTAYESLVASIKTKIAQNDEELRYSGRLTDSDKLRLQMLAQLDAGSKTLTATHKARTLALLETLDAQEKEKEAVKRAQAAYQEQVAIQEELSAAYVADSKARESGRQAVTDYAKGIQESADALKFELSLMGLSEQAREVALEQYRIELQLKRQIAAVNANSGFDQPQRDEEIARLQAAAAIARANASSKVFLDNWKESVKQYDDIFRQGFADMLNNGQDGWKSFTRSLVTTFKTTVADQIYKMFAQPFVVNLVGNLMGITGGGSGVAGAVSAGSSLISTASSASSAYSLFSGNSLLSSIPGLGALGGAISGFGTAITASLQSLIGLTGTTSQMVASLAAAGHAAAPGVAAGVQAANLIPGWGWALAGVGALFGGDIFSGLFGRKLKDQGLEGQFGGDSGFEGRTYQYYKGGLFRSNKTRYGELDEELRAALGDQFNALRAGAADMADVLGLGTDAIDNFTASIKVSFNDLDEEGIQKALKEEFDKVAETLASATLGTTEYTRVGETSVEALARLSGSLSTVNGVFDNLGTTLYASSLAGADMASSLLDLFGGADGFNAASGTYFQNFYSADEQRAAMQRQLQAQLGKIDLKLPDIDATDARAQYRALTEAQDLTTESGRKAYAMLLQLAGSFAAITDAASSNAEELARIEADRQKKIADTRAGLDERLLAAQGNDRGVLDLRRKQEYDALYKLDPALAALVAQIYALEDASTAAAAAAQREAEAVARAAEIESKGFDLTQRLLIAEGRDREALDLRRAQEYDALWKLDPALAAMVARIYELEDAAQRAADAEAARGSAMRDLADAMGRQREVWEGQLEALGVQRQVQQEALGLITGIFDLVRSNARDLYGEVGATAAMQASQGNAFIAQALANAQRTGYLPEQDALQQAISGARAGLDSSQYKTQVDADFARLVLAGQLKGLEDIAGPQKTAAEQQIERLDAQTETLQRLIREAQKEYDLLQRQVDIANGTYNATITVAEATAKIIELLGGKKPAGNADDNGGAVFGGTAPSPAGAGSGAKPAPAKYSRVYWIGGADAGYEGITDQSLIDRLDKLAPVYHSFDGTGDLLGLGEAFKQAGGTIADLSILSGNYEADWRKAFASVGIPAFAVGTNYVPYDTPAVVHKGERIIPAADNRALMAAVNAGGQGNTARLEALVQQLVEDNRLQAGEILRLQNRLAKVIEKWDGDGLPHERDEAVTA
ncbi:tape measure protein [Acidovorax sp. FG27]|uniref:tape measure protein n=1 Tax=Acidovorax sp. FG27 TaxID=3133652 RepID=UPI0030E9558D